jgi:hypothetical protein
MWCRKYAHGEYNEVQSFRSEPCCNTMCFPHQAQIRLDELDVGNVGITKRLPDNSNFGA